MVHGLGEELRLMIFPVVLGAGERLFGADRAVKPMRLIAARTVGESLAFLGCQPA
jgi:dihydrofolate reductase